MKRTLSASSASVLALTAVSLLAAAPSLVAQLPSASASALGLAGNNTASVRGFGAISVNPAGLGMPGSGFSLAVMPLQVRLGLDPVTLGELADFEGIVVPNPIKQDWLTRATAAGGEAGSVTAEVSGFALTLGNVGFQLSSVASVDVNLPPGAVEALLYGNAGRTGSATDLSLVGAAANGFAMSTAAMSFAMPLGPQLVVGVTGKYSLGHGLVLGRADTGAVTANPLGVELEFPLITTCEEAPTSACEQDWMDGGSGLGLDLGAMIQLTGVTLGASIHNIINTFSWNEARLGYRPGTISLVGGEFETEYDEVPYAAAPTDLKSRVADFTFRPSLQLGAALDLTDSFTLTGDLHRQLGSEGISLGPVTHIGVGGELRALGFLHLRAGASKVTEGLLYAGGASLVLGPVNLSGAAAVRRGDLSDSTLLQIALSFGNR